MKETKYYTPTIEEFHIGFECECNDEETGFESITICSEDLKNRLDEEYNFQEKGSINPEYRVKCTNLEDIESFGFKTVATFDNYILLNYKDFVLVYIVTGFITVDKITDKGKWTLFNGKIKNKSELKRVLQQLEII